jgi:hypothetical protein
MDPEAYGGAPLLGFAGAVMKCHGSSKDKAVASAIRVTLQNLSHHVNESVATEIARANETLDGLGLLNGAPSATGLGSRQTAMTEGRVPRVPDLEDPE